VNGRGMVGGSSHSNRKKATGMERASVDSNTFVFTTVRTSHEYLKVRFVQLSIQLDKSDF